MIPEPARGLGADYILLLWMGTLKKFVALVFVAVFGFAVDCVCCACERLGAVGRCKLGYSIRRR